MKNKIPKTCFKFLIFNFWFFIFLMNAADCATAITANPTGDLASGPKTTSGKNLCNSNKTKENTQANLEETNRPRVMRIGKKLIETIEINDIEYVPVGSVVAALQGAIWQLKDKWLVMVPLDSSKKEIEIIFTINSDTVVVNKRVVSSPFPVQFTNNELLVPVFILGEIFPLPQPTVPTIQSMTLSQSKDTTVLRIEIDTTVLYETETPSSLEYRLYFQALSTIQNVKPLGIIKRISLASKNGTYIALFFNKPCDQKILRTGDGFLLKCFPRPQKKITTIVLDPGHGGRDPGAVGKAGLKEKVVNLYVALRLKTKLEAIGLRVVLTRTDDRYVSLSDRVKFARLGNADLFISIHSNAAVRDRKKRGFETYFLSDAKTDWERAVAARENAAIQFEVSDTNPITTNDLGLILSDLAQNEFLVESQQLAAAIQEASAGACGIPSRGVMQANFYVLRVNFMPAVLVECGYVSNPAEEKLLTKNEFREKIAAGIFLGIKKFISEYEKKFAEK
jgi:N-acetylmuramoyl-L-alanine amidase